MKNFVVCGRFDGESEIVKFISANFEADACRKLEEIANNIHPDKENAEFYILFSHEVDELIKERVVVTDSRFTINGITCLANLSGLGNYNISFMGYEFAKVRVNQETCECNADDLLMAEVALKTLINSGFKYAKVDSLTDDVSAIENFDQATISKPVYYDRNVVPGITVSCGDDSFLIYDDEMLYSLLKKLEDNPAFNPGLFDDRMLRRTLHLFIANEGAAFTVWEDMEGWFIQSTNDNGLPAKNLNGYIMPHRKASQEQIENFEDTVKGYIKDFSASYTTMYEDTKSQFVSQ